MDKKKEKQIKDLKIQTQTPTPPEPHEDDKFDGEQTEPLIMLMFFTTKARRTQNAICDQNWELTHSIIRHVLTTYETYKTFNKNKPNSNKDTQTAFDAFEACYQLCLTTVLLIRCKIPFEGIDLEEIKDKLVLIFAHKTHCKLFYMTLDLMAGILLKQNHLTAANAFIEVSIDVHHNHEEKLSSKHSILPKINHLRVQLQYFLQYFVESQKALEKPMEEICSKDEIFKNLVMELKIKPCFYFNEFVKNIKRAEQVVTSMEIVMTTYENIVNLYLYFCESVLDHTELKISQLVFKGAAHHFLNVFHTNQSKKLEQVLKANTYFDEIRKEMQNGKNAHMNVVSVEDMEMNAVAIFEERCKHYKSIIAKEESAALKCNDPVELDTQIKYINELRKSFLPLPLDFLKGLEENPVFWSNTPLFVKGKILLLIGKIYRSFILDDKEEQKKNLEISLKYLKKLSDLTINNEFNKTLNILPDQIGVSVESFVLLVDQNPFVAKFRKD